MRKIKIVSDSSSDMLTMTQIEFASAPLKITCGDTTFVDDSSLDLGAMAAFFDKYKGRSITSCPSTGDWLAAFGDADDIFCTTITSGLSGSYNSACAAKQVYESEHEGKRVFVIDTLSTGPEMTLILCKLEQLILEGKSFEEICGIITEYQKKTGLLFMLKSLKSFANNGRISPAVAKIAGLVGICIVGKASDKGTLEPLHKCRGEAKSLSAILSELEAAGLCRGKVSIAHNRNPEGAEKLKDMILGKFKDASVEIHTLRGLCSYYAETGGILVGYEKL